MIKDNEKNIAFIDGQNLYMGTTENGGGSWKVDLARFRIYLQKKYHVNEAYYFLGYVNEKYQDLYIEIQEAGFILIFKQHTAAMQGKKKGNVDTDIVFHVMKKLYKQDLFDKIVIVSGDGDYKILVDFLIEEGKLKKILFPNKRFASSLYKKIGSELFDYLDQDGIKNKIQKEKGSLGS
ncbi:MAG: NYN domain-containing protein [Candidatus Uhrbacteria bacterium]